MATAKRYCVPGGAGAKDGLSWATAWDLAQAMADGTTNKVVNIAGAFTEGTNRTHGSGFTQFIGWKADLSARADSWDDAPSIDFATLASGNAYTLVTSVMWFFVEFKNAPAYVLYTTSVDYCGALFCKFTDCVQLFRADDWCFFAFNLVDGTTGDSAVFAGNSFRHVCNEYHNCTSTILVRPTGPGGTEIGNYYSGTSAQQSYFQTAGGLAAFNTYDDASGIALDARGNDIVTAFNILSNSLTAWNSAFARGVSYFDNFYNNTNDFLGAGGLDAQVAGKTTLNPLYGGLPSDYSIGEGALIDFTPTDLIQSFNVGAWQGGGGGGGGGAVGPFGTLR